MSELIDKLEYLEGTKALLKAKLGAGDNVPFRDYVGLVPAAQAWSQAEYEAEYAASLARVPSRPSDWLAMPAMAEGDQKAAILCAVYDTDSEYAILTVRGAHTVDWGDGTVENFASGANASHKYAYSSLPDSSLCSDGYKQALITVTPQAGQSFTSISLGGSHPISKARSNYIDVKMAGQAINAISVNGLQVLRRFEFIGSNQVTSFSGLFTYCQALEWIPQLYTGLGTMFNSMFYGCFSLKALPQLDTHNGINFSEMFNSCVSLTVSPPLNLSSGQQFYQMFGACSELIMVPQFDTGNGVNFQNMFGTCSSIRSMPQLNTHSGTNFNGMFSSCAKLSSIPYVDTSNGTSFSNMFGGCSRLETIPAIDTSKGTDFSVMFNNCSSLTTIPQLDTSKGTNFSGMLSYCKQLRSIPLTEPTSPACSNSVTR